MVLVFCAIYQAVLWRRVLIAYRSAAVERHDQEGICMPIAWSLVVGCVGGPP